MLRPSIYNAACQALLGSNSGEGLIDHDPGAARDSQEEKRERLRRTRVAYKIIFGHPAPSSIWWFFNPGSLRLKAMLLWSGEEHSIFVNPGDTTWSLEKRIEVIFRNGFGTWQYENFKALKFGYNHHNTFDTFASGIQFLPISPCPNSTSL